MKYYTIKNYSAGDLAGSTSSLTGTDLGGVSWAFVKFADDATIPTFTGSAVELGREEAQIASQSALYRPAAGELYRQAAIAFGVEVVESFISQAANLPTPIADRALELLTPHALAGIEGFVSLLRYLVATTPATPGSGFTAAAKAALLANMDLWLEKFPGKASPVAAATPAPQMETIDQSSDGAILASSGRYLVDASASAFAVVLPAHSEQASRTPRGVMVDNRSASTVTVEISPADVTAGITFTGGGTSQAVAAGERFEALTASGLWVEKLT